MTKTLRDEFAMAAIQTVWGDGSGMDEQDTAQIAYQIADAMLEFRAENPEEQDDRPTLVYEDFKQPTTLRDVPSVSSDGTEALTEDDSRDASRAQKAEAHAEALAKALSRVICPKGLYSVKECSKRPGNKCPLCGALAAYREGGE